MQLAVCRPVLLAAAAPDGRHLALLLSSHSLPQEPSEVLVLRLLQPGEGSEGCGRGGGSGGGGDPAAACSVAVVAAVEVQRSQWGEGLQLGPNCLQLAVTAK